jgi:hypothetical protein
MKKAIITLEDGQTFDTLCSPNYEDEELIEKFKKLPCHGPTPTGRKWQKVVAVTIETPQP